MAESRPGLASREEAQRFVTAFADTIAELDRLLAHETACLAKGRVREALGQSERKTDLTGGYLRAVEFARANAIAIARFAPSAVVQLKGAHDRLRATVERNQSVLATAKAVSEGFVRGVSEEVARQSRPAGYGQAARHAGPARPLVLSTRL